MDINQKVLYWVDLAKDNLETAKILLENKKYIDCGFYCHQVIEKTLKGYFWVINKEEPPYTHNLIRLAEKSNLYNSLSEEQKKFLDFLMPLNIEGRYPDEKEEILKDISCETFKEIVENTEGLHKWILQLLKK